MAQPSATSSRQTALTATVLPSMAILVAIVLMTATTTAALDCIQCGEYNDDGVGAITPCLNYSDAIAHNYLKRCPRATHKFCIKYVSELSVVRDCVEECKEKEVWDTRTYCCNEDGCNGAPATPAPTLAIVIASAAAFSALLHHVSPGSGFAPF